jgi:hypothetical protein
MPRPPGGRSTIYQIAAMTRSSRGAVRQLLLAVLMQRMVSGALSLFPPRCRKKLTRWYAMPWKSVSILWPAIVAALLALALPPSCNVGRA